MEQTEKGTQQEKMDELFMNLDDEISNFMELLFEAYDIQFELEYTSAVEENFYNIVEATKKHIMEAVRISEVKK